MAKGGIQVSGFHSQRVMGPLVEMGKMGEPTTFGGLGCADLEMPMRIPSGRGEGDWMCGSGAPRRGRWAEVEVESW